MDRSGRSASAFRTEVLWGDGDESIAWSNGSMRAPPPQHQHGYSTSPDRSLAGLMPRSPSQAECTNHDATRLRLTDSGAARVRTIIRPHHLPAHEVLRLQIEAGRRPSPFGSVAKSFFPESAYVSSHGPGKHVKEVAGGRDPYYFPVPLRPRSPHPHPHPFVAATGKGGREGARGRGMKRPTSSTRQLGDTGLATAPGRIVRRSTRLRQSEAP